MYLLGGLLRQYQNDRDPKEKTFSFARCMVHFAADTEQMFMCSELKGKASFFIPFNKGLNDGKSTPPFGAGNPINPDKQNAKISSDKKVEDLMQQYLFTQTEIFKKLTMDQDFQRRYKEFIFDTLWTHQNKEPPINP